MKRARLGSLFDGSGGFPLAGSLCGIRPVWAAEVEPYPIAVTCSRFPSMKHLGSVTDIHGGEVEPVDIITFGSPCQDLSVAGKRAGLKHEDKGDEETTRSGLFMEAVRIIKEMREATNGQYPTFALWENVPGAFSSNKGEDFRTVLEELIGIVEPGAVVPPVPKAGWAYADSYTGDGWSLAYRVFDAQHWGVPQRRRRIHLVLDLRGQRAREVLFERKGVRGYFEASGAQGQGAAEDAQGSPASDDRAGAGSGTRGRGLDAVTVYGVDNAITTGGNCTAQGPCVYEDIQATLKASGVHAVAYTLKIRCGKEGGGKGALIPVPGVLLDDQGGQQINVRTDGKSPTLRAETHGNLPCVVEAAGFKAGQSMAGGIGWQEECAATLAAECSGTEPTVCIKAGGFCHGQSAKARGIGWEEEMAPTLRVGMTPAIMCKTYDGRGYGDGENVRTITGGHESSISDYTSLVVYGEPVYCLQGNGIDRADTAGCNGKGWKEDSSYTLNTIDRPAVAYLASGKGTVGTLMASMATKQCLGDQEAFSGDYHIVEETPQATYAKQAIGEYKQSDIASSQTARQYKEPTDLIRVQYIVRRLTPTECARLQGFPDAWGHPDKLDSLSPEEYRFWLEVRKTHAAINGKQTKDYNETQMLKWYNGLHTDSAEYKMWGNGIALPPALYCMQGIAGALEKEAEVIGQ